MTAIDYILRLEEAGYFKYTEKDYLQQVKDSLAKHFIEEKELMTSFHFDGPFQTSSMDLRFYNCGDCEELFEHGGVISLIEEMKPLFDKIGLSIKYSDDNYENYMHTIKVNNRIYLLADNSPLGWGETFEKYADMINKELAIEKADERIFLFSHDSGEYMVFLTPSQNEIISKYLDESKRPLKVEEWVAKMLNN